jgi:hypothetical protein
MPSASHQAWVATPAVPTLPSSRNANTWCSSICAPLAGALPRIAGPPVAKTNSRAAGSLRPSSAASPLGSVARQRRPDGRAASKS